MTAALTVVVPYYRPQYFRHTLDALANQTNKEFCVSVGDDNSPTDPIGLIGEFRSQLNIVYKRFANNVGHDDLAAQWNRCVRLAGKAEWVWVLPDDDVPTVNCVAEFQAARAAADAFGSDVMLIPPAHEAASPANGKLEVREAGSLYFDHIIGGGRGLGTLGNAIYRKARLEDAGGFVSFPRGWGSDHATVLAVAGTRPILELCEAGLWFRMSGLNISSQKHDGAQKLAARRELFNWIETYTDLRNRPSWRSFREKFYFRSEYSFVKEWQFGPRTFWHLMRLRAACLGGWGLTSALKATVRKALAAKGI